MQAMQYKGWFKGRARKKSMGLCLGLILTWILHLSLPALSASSTKICWDIYGVPHIEARNSQELFQGFGWAQMKSHGNLLLRLYGQARGRAAEYWGESYQDSDQWVRTMGIPERAQTWYTAQSPNFRHYLDAFAAGVNAYAQAHGEQLEDDLEVVLPISAVDLLAHTHRVLHFTFVVNPEEIQGKTPLEPTTGSNGWAIAPIKSANSHALLLANPHLPWTDLFRWYEAHLIAPGLNAYGAALVGVPVLSIAFNDHLGWTHTVNTFDGWDAYALKLVENGYEFDGRVRSFETERQSLKIKQSDGSLKSEPLQIRRSVQGPVWHDAQSKAIALRVVGLDRPGALEEWWQMARAHNLQQFEAALKRLQIPLFNVLYADQAGHILQVFNAQVPVRSGGTFANWSQIQPGETSKTLWQKIHSYQDLPRLLDPTSGWLQNANDAPWTMTFPAELKASDYPAYMAPAGPMYFRAQRSAKMLTESGPLTLEKMIELKHSTRMALADRLVNQLIAAARQRGNPLAQKAATVLAKWDRTANAGSRGAALFAAWADTMEFDQLFADTWQPDQPFTTPNTLADPAKAVTALEQVAQKIQQQYGSLEVPWGEVFRLQGEGVDLPASGGPGFLGIFRVLDFQPTSGPFQAMGGDSYVAAVEFSRPVRAQVLTSYGNATQPGLPSATESLSLVARQQLHPAWRSRSEIKAHLFAQESVPVGKAQP
ncbi:Penicillin amidase superfamily [uncultured Leptolyngbya sp.]|uniref:Penicillin amidase superfamily n=1 Tax=uncultured Leptolyngbya sp. TaxID=332963 RepID=A0A6J4M0H7_9CYAN|nr:Penicillin amidase superfamily [uncultured Leptolyngbya sp.]